MNSSNGSGILIPTNFLDAERMAAALTTSIVDSMAAAGADADATLEEVRQARQYAETLVRFLTGIESGLDGPARKPEPDHRGDSVHYLHPRDPFPRPPLPFL